MKNDKQVNEYKVKHKDAVSSVDKNIQMHHFIGESKQFIDLSFFQ